MPTVYLYENTHLMHHTTPLQSECLGSLPDAITCEIERDVTGLFSLELTYPLTGKRADEITLGRWLSADAGGDLGYQYFEIVSLETADPGEIYVQASHASYAARHVLAVPFTAVPDDNFPNHGTAVNFYKWSTALENAVDQISSAQWGGDKYLGLSGLGVMDATDEMSVNPARYTEPVTLYQAVLDAAEGRADLYLRPNNFQLGILFYFTEGDPVFTLRYGKNMKKFGQSSNLDDFYTAVLPYALSKDDEFLSDSLQRYQLKDLPDELSNVYYTRPLNITGLYEYDPDVSDLTGFRMALEMWLERNPFTAPAVETTITAAEDAANHFELGAVGCIYYEPLHFTGKAAVSAMTYDALAGRVTSVSVGGVPQTVIHDIAWQKPGKALG